MATLTINPAVQLAAMVRMGLMLRLTVHPTQTIEASGSGYAAVSLTRWTIEGRRAIHEEVKFHFTGALGPVYGYFVTAPDGAVLLRDEIKTPEDEPPVIRVAGDEIWLTPVLRVI